MSHLFVKEHIVSISYGDCMLLLLILIISIPSIGMFHSYWNHWSRIQSETVI